MTLPSIHTRIGLKPGCRRTNNNAFLESDETLHVACTENALADFMKRNLTSLIRPQSLAVIGASAKNVAQGNLVIENLLSRSFPGPIIPVHREARNILGLAAIKSIEDLPDGIDLAVASVPAKAAAKTALELDAKGVKSAIFFASGFTKKEETDFQSVANTVAMNIHGPNCMGLINCTDSIFLYPAKTLSRLKAGGVSLIAQSGSAAITIMNSAHFGFSRIVSVGSEVQITSADYLAWMAEDESTSTVGIILESIKDPLAFSNAANRLYANGKSLVVLKIGKSKTGTAATVAHTGAMTSDADTYDLFFNDNGIATVNDYDELVASLECLSRWGHCSSRNNLAIAGISGGQTALACDIADDVGVALAEFSPTTQKQLQDKLPGTLGVNPLDFGAVVDKSTRDIRSAIDAVLNAPETDVLALVQDCHDSMSNRSLEVYREFVNDYCQSASNASNPVIAISPTSTEIHPEFRKDFERNNIPIINGLREAIVAIRSLRSRRDDKPPKSTPGPGVDKAHGVSRQKLREELEGHKGQLDNQTVFRILTAYDIPLVKSVTVPNTAAAVAWAGRFGFPLVAKVSSPDIAHRSELGGVMLGVTDSAMLKISIDAIASNISRAAPDARIDGYELQEEIRGDLEAMVGFTAAPPFGCKMIAGTGGTLVELFADYALAMAPVSADDALTMIASTTLGTRLAGYRNLLPETNTSPFVKLITDLSIMASDLGDIISECDLNPVLIRKGTGEVVVVDALMSIGATLQD
jgi:acyl-CoA synthetase (NDP forming)